MTAGKIGAENRENSVASFIPASHMARQPPSGSASTGSRTRVRERENERDHERTLQAELIAGRFLPSQPFRLAIKHIHQRGIQRRGADRRRRVVVGQ
jgi:hypothetical protein